MWYKLKVAFKENNLIRIEKHWGRNVMVWGGFASPGPGQLTVTESSKNSYVHQWLLTEKVKEILKKPNLNLKQNQIFQHNSVAKLTSIRLFKVALCLCIKWSSLSLDQYPRVDMISGSISLIFLQPYNNISFCRVGCPNFFLGEKTHFYWCFMWIIPWFTPENVICNSCSVG